MPKEKPAPTAEEIRAALVRAANAYAEKRKLTLAAVSKLAVGDNKFITAVRDGGGFTVERYQKAMDFLAKPRKRPRGPAGT